jgi:hypothetical protein
MDDMLDTFLSLLSGKPADPTVWTADIAYWIAGRQQAGDARPEWSTEEGFLRLHRDLGILPYYYYEKFWAAEPRYDDRIESNEAKVGGKTVRRIHTPLGQLREESVYSPLSSSQGITKHFVESEGDLEILLDVLRHRRLAPANLDDWPERNRLWQTYGGVPCIGLPRSPLAAFFVEWAGVQNGSYLLADCPEKCEEAFRLMEEQERPILDAVCELAPPVVHFPDNLSSDCSTGFYDRYMAGAHRQRIERLHAAGVKCAVHLDGTVKGLLPKLIRSGFDAIEALTPKPGGDLEIEEIRDLAGSELASRISHNSGADIPVCREKGSTYGRQECLPHRTLCCSTSLCSKKCGVILWGGVPGILFAPPYTWPQMESHVRRVLDSWQDRPFILGVADQVPPDGDIQFCRRIADLLKS